MPWFIRVRLSTSGIFFCSRILWYGARTISTATTLTPFRNSFAGIVTSAAFRSRADVAFLCRAATHPLGTISPFSVTNASSG